MARGSQVSSESGKDGGRMVELRRGIMAAWRRDGEGEDGEMGGRARGLFIAGTARRIWQGIAGIYRGGAVSGSCEISGRRKGKEEVSVTSLWDPLVSESKENKKEGWSRLSSRAELGRCWASAACA